MDQKGINSKETSIIKEIASFSLNAKEKITIEIDKGIFLGSLSMLAGVGGSGKCREYDPKCPRFWMICPRFDIPWRSDYESKVNPGIAEALGLTVRDVIPLIEAGVVSREELASLDIAAVAGFVNAGVLEMADLDVAQREAIGKIRS